MANFTADVELEDKIAISVPVTDLLVTHRAIEVAKDKTSKEFRKGKLVNASEVQFLQRENSLAQFVRVTSAPRKVVSPRQQGQKSQAKKAPKQSQDQSEQNQQQEPQPHEEHEPDEEDLLSEDPSATTRPKRVGLRFADGEEVFGLVGDDWLPGIVVTGDADVEDGPYYLM